LGELKTLNVAEKMEKEGKSRERARRLEMRNTRTTEICRRQNRDREKLEIVSQYFLITL
jgi:hypothetical protein